MTPKSGGRNRLQVEFRRRRGGGGSLRLIRAVAAARDLRGRAEPRSRPLPASPRQIGSGQGRLSALLDGHVDGIVGRARRGCDRAGCRARDSTRSRQDAGHRVALGPDVRFYQPAILGLATTVAHMSSVLLIAVVLWYTGATRVATLHEALTKSAGFAIGAVGLWRVGRQLAGYSEHGEEVLAASSIDNRGLIGLGLAGGVVPCWDAVALCCWWPRPWENWLPESSWCWPSVREWRSCSWRSAWLAWKLKSAAFGAESHSSMATSARAGLWRYSLGNRPLYLLSVKEWPYCLIKVATEICGQSIPAKWRMTSWVYCN